MDKAASLEIKNVTKTFGGVTAVNDVSFSVKPKQIFGIIGPNGAGKTTLFNMITGVYPPTMGEILLDGDSVVGKTTYQIANSGVARTFQNIRLFSELSVYDNMITSCQKHITYNMLDGMLKTPKYRQQERKMAELAEETLKAVGIWELRDQISSNLPYGQQRRLEIARALITDPKLLLLDEPAAGMNEDESAKLSGLIKDIRSKYGLTIVVIDHHMDVIMDTCDIITVLNFGSKLAEGTPQEIQSNPLVIEAYLGVDE